MLWWRIYMASYMPYKWIQTFVQSWRHVSLLCLGLCVIFIFSIGKLLSTEYNDVWLLQCPSHLFFAKPCMEQIYKLIARHFRMAHHQNGGLLSIWGVLLYCTLVRSNKYLKGVIILYTGGGLLGEVSKLKFVKSINSCLFVILFNLCPGVLSD